MFWKSKHHSIPFLPEFLEDHAVSPAYSPCLPSPPVLSTTGDMELPLALRHY